MVAEYTPGDREVAGFVISLLKSDPSVENLNHQQLLDRIKEEKKEENWSLSVKRLKKIMKDYNLFLKSAAKEFSPYSKHIFYKSDYVPTLGPGIRLVGTKKRGRGLYASKKFNKGDVIWTEEPLVVAPDVEYLDIIRNGDMCRYCGKPVLKGVTTLLRKEDQYVQCNKCAANWCSKSCRRGDLVHDELVHGTREPTKDKSLKHLNVSRFHWELFEQFANRNNWNAVYLYALMLVNKLKHGKDSEFAKTIDGLAYVNQEKRQESVLDLGSLGFEQLEQVWKEGYALLKEALKPSYNLSYEEYLNGIGCANINNIQLRIYGIYAMVNHNCDPNIEIVHNNWTTFKAVAKRDIEPNEELYTTYVNPEDNLKERQTSLYYWGFICRCERCKREGVENLKITL